MKKATHYLFWTVSTILLFIGMLGLWVLLPIQPEPRVDTRNGVTYSIHAAEALGMDSKEVFNTMIDELNPEIIRIPVYWNLIEKERGDYDFTEYDRQLDYLTSRRTKVIFAIGHKVPRWPECHLPDWVNNSDISEIEIALFEMLTEVVNRYKHNQSVYAWQVENEALFPFGDCPEWSINQSRLQKEIELVKRLDPSRKVMTSDSGELSLWTKSVSLPIDELAISLYRVVYNADRGGYFHWPVNPYYYSIRIGVVRLFVDDVVITELQMEPWGPESVQEMNNEEVFKSFSPFHFQERIDFASRTGAGTVLSWGVEWWYYMKQERGIPDYWEQAKVFYRK